MNRPDASRGIARDADPPGVPDTALRGSRLVIARVAWFVITTCILVLSVVTFLPYVKLLQTPCAAALCPAFQPSPQAIQAFQRIEISLGDYAIITVAFTAISALLWMGIGFFMFWRRSSDWMVLIFSLQCVVESISSSVLFSLEQHPGGWDIPAQFMNVLNTSLLFLVLALFPNGQFSPHWMRWLVLVCITFYGTAILFPHVQVANLLGGLFFFPFAASLLGGQIYRYRRISTPTERQQTKWVIASLVGVILLQIGVSLPFLFFPSLRLPGSLYQLVHDMLDLLIALIIPLSIAIAMLRYRLWDVDIFISRALVYGSLSGMLALVYFGCVVGLQGLLQGFSGQSSPVAIVISTLVVAALFQPFRRRIQVDMDRRFYRRKYDAARTLEAFSATLRSEVDLATLRENLLAVVQETMQPAHASLWLRPSEKVDRQREEMSSEQLPL